MHVYWCVVLENTIMLIDVYGSIYCIKYCGEKSSSFIFMYKCSCNTLIYDCILGLTTLFSRSEECV